MRTSRGGSGSTSVLLSFYTSETGDRAGGDGCAQAIRSSLMERGFLVLTLGSGQRTCEKGSEWAGLMKEAVTRSRVFVPIFSPSYVETPWTLAELQLAHAKQKICIPIWHSGLHPKLSATQFVGDYCSRMVLPHGDRPYAELEDAGRLQLLSDQMTDLLIDLGVLPSTQPLAMAPGIGREFDMRPPRQLSTSARPGGAAVTARLPPSLSFRSLVPTKARNGGGAPPPGLLTQHAQSLPTAPPQRQLYAGPGGPPTTQYNDVPRKTINRPGSAQYRSTSRPSSGRQPVSRPGSASSTISIRPGSARQRPLSARPGAGLPDTLKCLLETCGLSTFGDDMLRHLSKVPDQLQYSELFDSSGSGGMAEQQVWRLQQQAIAWVRLYLMPTWLKSADVALAVAIMSALGTPTLSATSSTTTWSGRRGSGILCLDVLGKEHVGAEGAGVLACMLESSQNPGSLLPLRAIYASGCSMMPSGTSQLLRAMAKSPNRIEEVDLSNNQLDDSIMPSLCAAACAGNSLRRVVLARNRITDEGGASLFRGLAGSGAKSKLDSIDLSGNSLGPLTWRAMHDTLAPSSNGPPLKTLILASCGLKPPDLCALVPEARPPSVMPNGELEMYGKGANASLFEAPRARLDLAGNLLESAGIEALRDAMHKAGGSSASMPQVLNLSKCASAVHDSRVRTAAGGLGPLYHLGSLLRASARSKPHLLKLSACNLPVFSPEDLTTLFSSFAMGGPYSLSNLNSLDLSGCMLGAAGSKALAGGLQYLPSLTSLTLTKSGAWDGEAPPLLGAFKVHATLLQLLKRCASHGGATAASDQAGDWASPIPSGAGTPSTSAKPSHRSPPTSGQSSKASAGILRESRSYPGPALLDLPPSPKHTSSRPRPTSLDLPSPTRGPGPAPHFPPPSHLPLNSPTNSQSPGLGYDPLSPPGPGPATIPGNSSQGKPLSLSIFKARSASPTKSPSHSRSTSPDPHRPPLPQGSPGSPPPSLFVPSPQHIQPPSPSNQSTPNRSPSRPRGEYSLPSHTSSHANSPQPARSTSFADLPQPSASTPNLHSHSGSLRVQASAPSLGDSPNHSPTHRGGGQPPPVPPLPTVAEHSLGSVSFKGGPQSAWLRLRQELTVWTPPPKALPSDRPPSAAEGVGGRVSGRGSSRGPRQQQTHAKTMQRSVSASGHALTDRSMSGETSSRSLGVSGGVNGGTGSAMVAAKVRSARGVNMKTVGGGGGGYGACRPASAASAALIAERNRVESAIASLATRAASSSADVGSVAIDGLYAHPGIAGLTELVSVFVKGLASLGMDNDDEDTAHMQAAGMKAMEVEVGKVIALLIKEVKFTPTSLSIGGNLLCARAARGLGAVLALSPNLSTLNLPGTTFAPGAVTELAVGFKASAWLSRSGVLPNSSLISLDISGCQLIADQCGQLAHILAASQNLQRLILDDNRMSEKALQVLLTSLVKNCKHSLICLSVQRCCWARGGMEAVVASLQYFPLLEALMLQGNFMDTHIAQDLAEILPSLRHLRELHLGGSSNSQLGSQGASALGHSLATAPSLSVLSVVACGLHDGSMSGFAAAALNQHRLTMLNLSNNQIGRIGSAELLGAVAQRPTSAAPLQVDLSGNPLPTDSQQLWQLRRQALAVQQAGSKGIQD